MEAMCSRALAIETVNGGLRSCQATLNVPHVKIELAGWRNLVAPYKRDQARLFVRFGSKADMLDCMKMRPLYPRKRTFRSDAKRVR